MSKKNRRPHHHHERTEARRLALQVLYQSEMVEKAPSAILADKAYVAEEGVPSAYAERLLRGVEEHREEIDDQLRTASENWTLSRMPAVDRALLRMAACEMLYVDEVPLSVSINEAVELAKRFGGGDDSHRFVNGILGRIARGIEAEGAQAAEEELPSAVDLAAAAFARELAEEGEAPVAAGAAAMPQDAAEPAVSAEKPAPAAVSAEDAAQE
ncbi:MAG TPA: transcription antitermination factor NusB [Candidatus Aveggerthella excrementigallinarum]|nr:transcription antitermination factor NusB [Candidatus Aveggerthella excrementigallinarum]